MNRKHIYFILLPIVLMVIVGCSSFGNPFVGSWESGAFNLNFKSDKTFELSLGDTLSVNLDGTYVYDDEKLTLALEGHSEMVFAYEFKDGKKKMVLTPETESGYLNTKLEFTRQ